MAAMSPDTAAGPLREERVADHVVLLTLSRPNQLNAIDPEMTVALEQAVLRNEADPTVRVVILSGAGDRAFCVGDDLNTMAEGRMAELMTEAGDLAGFVRQPRRKPWIAAVNGFALAGGLEIALACDIIIASENATFGAPEVTIGWAATAGGTLHLPRRIPTGPALEMLLTGQPIDAGRALGLGLATRVVPLARLRDEAIGLAQAIAANAPSAVEKTLALVRASLSSDAEEVWRLALEARAAIAAGRDGVEGVLAVIEKRKPKWT